MRKQVLIFFLAALAVVTGCKKDNDKPAPANPSATKVLKRIVETENGVTTTHTFSYDANKRLTSVMSSDGQEAVLFTYDNNGNVVKVENKVANVTNFFEFTYNNGVPVSGSFESFRKSGTEDILTTSYDLLYTVSNGVVSQITTVMPNPENEQEPYETEYSLTYSNGNLAKIASPEAMLRSLTFTYGNKKPIYPVVFTYVMDPAGFSTHFFARNEILAIAYDYAVNEMDDNITTAYTYDAQGYVLTADDGQTQSRFEYE